MKTIKGYKFIKSNMQSKNGNIIWKVGEWQKHEGEIELCESGFHACKTALQSLEFTYGDKWFIVEAKGKMLEEEGKKFVSSEMRLIKEIPIDKVVRLFAIRCAKRCLINYEKLNPQDKRPAEAIQAAEDYLDNKISIDELNTKLSAARSAESAAWRATRSAESATRSAESAAWSAESAAWSAESAARSAAWSATRSAESAAWSAESAARSAESAARSAAWSAESAARSAAWSAERKWQEKELNKIIKEILKNG